jgi:hypothetical protein
MTGYICGPAASDIEVLRTEPEPERWCFGERKRRTGMHILRGMTFEAVMRTGASGWAEPYWVYKCDGCGQDRRWMFGA